MEVRTDHFTIVGNAKEKKLREMASDLEKVRTLFQASLRVRRDPPVPVLVFVVKRESDLQALAPHLWQDRKGPAGFFLNARTRILIGMRTDVRSAEDVAFHEYHHLLLDQGTPHVPVWLREGLANLWGQAKIDGRSVEVGRPETLFIEYVATNPLIEIGELVDAGHDSKYYRHSRHAGMFYAQSTVLTHMLLIGDPEGPAKVQRYIDLIGGGTPLRDAFEQTWGPANKVEMRLRGYLRNSRFSYQRTEIGAEVDARTTTIVRELGASETLAYRGQFLALLGVKDSAVPVLLEALKLDSGDPRAASALALLSPRPEALDLLTRATSRPEADFDAHWHLAQLLALTSSGSPAIVSHLEKSIELAPAFAPPYERLALLRAAESPDAALDLLQKAVTLDLSRPGYLLSAAFVLRERKNRSDEAGRVAEEAVSRALSIPRADIANDVCWQGALLGFAETVLRACDEAVLRAPDRWHVLDSRGVARGAAGDDAGALEDLRAAVKGAKASKVPPEAFIRSREAMILLLASGKNPFTAETLSALGAPPAWSSDD